MEFDKVNHLILNALIADLSARGKLRIPDLNILIDKIGNGLPEYDDIVADAKNALADIQHAVTASKS